MRAEVIIPWRGGCDHRERALKWVCKRHRWPVVIGESGSDEWVKAHAVNDALHKTSADIVIVADADCWTEGLIDAVDAVADGAPWAVPHATVWRLDESGSSRFMDGEPLAGMPLDQRPYRGYRGGGFVIAPRQTLIDVPLDPRFIGWGHEDSAWAMALMTLAGYPWRGSHPLIHFWHPPQARPSRRRGSVESLNLERRYQRAMGDTDAMKSLIGEIDDDHHIDHKSNVYRGPSI